MIQLPPSEFTFGKYGTGTPFMTKMNEKTWAEWLTKKNVVGFCHSLDVEIRPRTNCVVVMVEEDDWESWDHVPIKVWESYLKMRKDMKL